MTKLREETALRIFEVVSQQGSFAKDDFKERYQEMVKLVQNACYDDSESKDSL